MSGYLRGLVLRTIDVDSMVEPLLGAPLGGAPEIRPLHALHDRREFPDGDLPSPAGGKNGERTAGEETASLHEPDPRGAREIRAPRSDRLRAPTVRYEGKGPSVQDGRGIGAPPDPDVAQARSERLHPDSQEQAREGDAAPARRTGITAQHHPGPKGEREAHSAGLLSLPRGGEIHNPRAGLLPQRVREIRGAIEPPTLILPNTRDEKSARGSVSLPKGRSVRRAGFGVEPAAGRRPGSESSASDGGASRPAAPPRDELVGPPRSDAQQFGLAPSRPLSNSSPGHAPAFPDQLVPPVSPTIEVTIGRIEVRGGTVPTRPARPRWSPTPMTLADYLDRRARKDRG
jgi:hypothetical protein